jgi:transposase
MKLMYKRCAGLDVHQRTVVACVRVVDDTKLTEEVRTFDTTTTGLLALSTWLEAEGCTHVAMEATGVYWKPAWHILEAKFDLVLANAAHIKNVPGRKTDVSDARWIADMLAHGLIRGSFVPPTPIQDLRALMRTRKQLVREAARNTQRIQKVLEDANIKLTGVVSDILGKSGRAVLDALEAGEQLANDERDLLPLLSQRRDTDGLRQAELEILLQCGSVLVRGRDHADIHAASLPLACGARGSFAVARCGEARQGGSGDDEGDSDDVRRGALWRRLRRKSLVLGTRLECECFRYRSQRFVLGDRHVKWGLGFPRWIGMPGCRKHGLYAVRRRLVLFGPTAIALSCVPSHGQPRAPVSVTQQSLLRLPAQFVRTSVSL